MSPIVGKLDTARVAALDARDAAVAAADAGLTANGLPTVSAVVAKHANISVSVRAAAKGAAVDAAGKLRRGAYAARIEAEAAAANGAALKSDAATAASQKLDTAADALKEAYMVVDDALDRKAAKKAGPPRRTMTVAVALQLPGPFADGTGVIVDANNGPAVAGRRRRGLAQTTTALGSRTAAESAALASARAGPVAANITPPPDVVIDAPLVSAAGVRDAVVGLLRARLRSLGSKAGLAPASLSATVTPVDPVGGVYAVSVSFRGDDATAAALANAVNDVPPRERACAGWIERVGFDFCGALAATMRLVVDGVQVRGESRVCASGGGSLYV